MSKRPGYVAPILIVLVALAAAPAPTGDENDRYALLQAMPRERRAALYENLERFEQLPPAEQAAIRKLDAQISRKEPIEQAKYRALLHRYHLWVNTLSEDQKKSLKEAGSDQARFNLALKLRQKELREVPSGPRFFGLRTGEYGLVGPYEAAHLLKIWNKLKPEKPKWG